MLNSEQNNQNNCTMYIVHRTSIYKSHITESLLVNISILYKYNINTKYTTFVIKIEYIFFKLFNLSKID